MARKIMTQDDRNQLASAIASELTEKDAPKNYLGPVFAAIDECVSTIAPSLPPEKHNKIVAGIQKVLPELARIGSIEFTACKTIEQCLSCLSIWATLAFLCSYPDANMDVIEGMFGVFRNKILNPQRVDLESFAPLLTNPMPRPLIIDADQINTELLNNLKNTAKNSNTPLKLSDITGESVTDEQPAEKPTEEQPKEAEIPKTIEAPAEAPAEVPTDTPEPSESTVEPPPAEAPKTTETTIEKTPSDNTIPTETKVEKSPTDTLTASETKVEKAPDDNLAPTETNIEHQPVETLNTTETNIENNPAVKPTPVDSKVNPSTYNAINTQPSEKLPEVTPAEATVNNSPIQNQDEPELTEFDTVTDDEASTQIQSQQPSAPEPTPQPTRREPIRFKLPEGFGKPVNSAVWNTPVITDFGYPFLNFSSEAILHLFKTKDPDDKKRTFKHIKQMLKEAKKRYGGIWKAIYGAPLELLKKFASDPGTLCVPNYLKVDADLLDEDSDAVSVTPIKYFSVDPAYEANVEVPRDFLENFYDVLDYTKAFKTYAKYSDGFTPQEFLEEIYDNNSKCPFYLLIPKQAKFSRTDVTTGSLFSALFGGARCVMLKTIFKGKRGCFLIEKKDAAKLYSDIN